MPKPIILKNTSVTSSLSAARSSVNEPSVATSGDVSLYSGNWYAARSTDGGLNWSGLDPYTYFPEAGGRFCCDQSLIYAPGIDSFFWLLQYIENPSGNTLRLASCASGDVINNAWEYLDLVPHEVNPNWTGLWFDYNHIALSDNFLYIGTNMFHVGGGYYGSVIFRLPLDAFGSSGASLTVEFYETKAFGSLRCTMGATDTMYFAAHNSHSSLEVFAWPESAAQPSQHTIPIKRWNWGSDFFAAADGAPNWMGRCDGRITGGWASGSEFGFTWGAPSQSGRPNPFIRNVRIDANTMTLVDEPDIWSTGIAFGWPEICPDNRGKIGISMFASAKQLHPSHIVGVFDSSAAKWDVALASRGSRSPADGKWGDYIHMRPLNEGAGWVTSAFTVQSGGTSDVIEPRYVEFT